MFCLSIFKYICCSTCVNREEDQLEEEITPNTSFYKKNSTASSSNKDQKIKIQANSIVEKMLKDLEMKAEANRASFSRDVSGAPGPADNNQQLSEEDLNYKRAACAILKTVFENIEFEFMDVSPKPELNIWM
jgi:hypothetical protein